MYISSGYNDQSLIKASIDDIAIHAGLENMSYKLILFITVFHPGRGRGERVGRFSNTNWFEGVEK